MTKKEVQQRVLQNGKPLALKKFSWCEKTNTFSTQEKGLVLDFKNVCKCNFKTGDSCIFKTDWGCTFETGEYCSFTTGSDCTFKTKSNCIFDTGWSCTFNTGWNCIFDTVSNCTFKTDSFCIFNIYRNGYFINNSKNNVVVVRYENDKKIYDLDLLENKKFIRLNINSEPLLKEIKHFEFIDNEIYTFQNKHTKGEYTLFKAQYIKDYFGGKKTYCTIAQKEYNGKIYNAHGTDIKNAIESLNFKITKNFSREDIYNDIKKRNNEINMYDYRLITGACEFGTKEWLKRNNLKEDTTMPISEFYENYKDKRLYAFDRFSEFYKEWFKG